MNSLDIMGVLRQNFDELHRIFEYEVPYSDDYNADDHLIKIKEWHNLPNSKLQSYPNGTRVAIHGHLDMHDKFGTIIVVEQLQVLK